MDAPTAAWPQTPWWVAYPARLDAELAALAAAGASWSSLGDGDGQSGFPGRPPVMRLAVSWPHPAPRPGDLARLDLVIVLPASYPWFQPTVLLPEPLPGLVRHRNPISGELCLLAADQDWQPGTTVAALLTGQLPRLLLAGRDDGRDSAVRALESGAEPVWTRLLPSRGALLVESECLPPPELPGGLADLAEVGVAPPVHALVRVRDGDAEPLFLSRTFLLREEVRVPWVRLDVPPAGRLRSVDLWCRGWAALAATVPSATHGTRLNLLLVLVPSEGAGRQRSEEFLLLTRSTERNSPVSAAPELDGQLPLFPVTDLWAQPEASSSANGAGNRHRVQVAVRRSHAIGRTDLTARLPGDRSERLAQIEVAVVGVGALGGPIALELARAGVGSLHLVDGDRHDAATAARQVPGIIDAGDAKALAVAKRIFEFNPHVRISAGLRHLGADEGLELPRLVEADLVVDASASPTVSRFLAAHLRATGTPLMVASATAGGWGGTLTTLPAVGGGCWECLQLHRADRSLPWPPALPDGWLLPVGCSEPTFVGGAVDLAEVALQAVRTAVALLAPETGTARHARRSPFGDVQVLSLRGRRGPQQPRWQSRRLTVHSGCPLHGGTADAHSAGGQPAVVAP